MGRTIDYEAARDLLEATFLEAEKDFEAGTPVDVPEGVHEAILKLFLSKSQSPREALIGVGIARILDPEIAIRFPYANLGDNAFNGRSLDEEVVNPFVR